MEDEKKEKRKEYMREYYKEWRKKNPQKEGEYRRKVWEKKLAQQEKECILGAGKCDNCVDIGGSYPYCKLNEEE
jgi:hypothetical protein